MKKSPHKGRSACVCVCGGGGNSTVNLQRSSISLCIFIVADNYDTQIYVQHVKYY